MASMDLQQGRARFRNLFSYLAVSILPILLCGLLLANNTYVRRCQQADETALGGLTLFSRTYSAFLSGMDACAGHLADNLPAYERENPSALSRQLASYQRNYELFTAVFYYQKGADSICTSEGLFQYLDFEELFSAEYGVDLTMTNLFTNMNGATTEQAIRSRALSASHADGEYIFYIRPVPALDARPSGVAVFVVSRERLLALLDECVPAGYDCYVYSTRYLTRLLRGGSREHADVLQETMNRLAPSQPAHELFAGENYVLMRVKSEQDDMNHMLAYKTKVLYAAFTAERNRTILLLLALLLPVAAVAYLLHRRMYAPIASLLRLPLPRDARTDEGDPLSAAVSGARTMIDQSNLMETGLLITLLYHGVYDSAFFLSMPYPRYTVLYAIVPQGAPLSKVAQHEETDGLCIYMVPMRKRGLVAILCSHGNMPREDLVRRVLSCLARWGVQPQKVGVGLSQNEVERIPLSRTQAQAVLESATDEAPVAYFADGEDAGLPAFLPMSGKLLLCQSIRNGSREIALSALRQMYEDIRPFSGDIGIQRSWCFFLYQAVYEVLMEKRLETLLAPIAPESLFYTSTENFLASLEPIVGEACDEVLSSHDRQLEDQQAKLLSYVQAHFGDQDLSLGLLSDRFHISESYITHLFRSETGLSFHQYVSSLRMEYVKAQLVESEDSIREIVNRAGYVDLANFTRKFRQAEGVTPGQWRDARRGDGRQDV